MIAPATDALSDSAPPTIGNLTFLIPGTSYTAREMPAPSLPMITQTPGWLRARSK